MNKKEKFYKMVGITKYGEHVMLNYVFEYDNGLKGAVGTLFIPVMAEEIEERSDREYLIEVYDLKFHWKESDSECSLNEYVDCVIAEQCDKAFPFQDDSYLNHISNDYIEKYAREGGTFECIGGGRVFSIEFETVFDQDLVNLINKYEES